MRRALALVLLLCSGLAASAQPQSVVDLFAQRTITSNGVTLGYRLFVPENYDPSVAYPLILALHGAGERGTNNTSQVAVHRLATTWADPVNQAEYPAFVVAPQVPPDLRWSAETDPDGSSFTNVQLATLAILDGLEAEFTIDPERVYVVGLSMGGHGTWDFISRLPGRFAAAVEQSGRGYVSQADDIAHIPIWAFHGELDTTVPPSESRRVIQAMEDLGRQVVYTECRRAPVSSVAFDCPGAMSADSLQAELDERADLLWTADADRGHGPWAPWWDFAPLHDWLFAQVRQDPDAVTLTAPASGTVWTGPATVTWTHTRDAADSVEVWLSRDGGRDWSLRGTTTLGEGAFALDATDGPDSPLARVRLIVLDDSSRAVGRNTGTAFRLDGPGDAPPVLRIDDEDIRFIPRVTADTYTLRLLAADPEGAALTATVYYSVDGGATYAQVMTADLAASPDEQTVEVDLVPLPNSDDARFRVDLTDGSATVTDESAVFTKATIREGSAMVQHVQGEGRGSVVVRLADPDAYNGHTYRLTIDDTEPFDERFDVLDVTTGQMVIQGEPYSDGIRESPLIGGLALLVEDAEDGEPDLTQTGWTTGDTDLAVAISGASVRISILTINLLATETTYTITMTTDVVGQSIRLYAIPVTDLRFTVTGGDGQSRDVVFRDTNGDGYPGNGDVLYLVEPDAEGEAELAWELRFSTSTIPPEPGDVFTLVPLPSLSSADVFEFTSPGTVATEPTPDDAPAAITAHFPNPFSETLTVAYRLDAPAAVRLDLFDALGRLVGTLHDASEVGGLHRAAWRGTLASGAYVVRLTATQANGTVTRDQRTLLHVAR